MKKWIYIAAGIIGFIGAIVGLYFYVKKSMEKIRKAISEDDNIFEEWDDQDTHCTSYHSSKQVVVPMGGIVPLNQKDYEWYINHINTVNLFDGDDGK